MRKLFLVAFVVIVSAVPVFAQQAGHSNTLTGFISDPEFEYSRGDGSHFNIGFGAALDHAFSDRVSAEISLTRQSYRRVTAYTANGTDLTPVTQTYRSFPIDMNVSYHFLTQSRWRPYIGGGARYVSERFEPVNLTTGQAMPTVHFRSLAPEVSGGVAYQFTPNVGLRLDAKQILGAAHGRGGVVDPDFKVAAGLSWRF